MEADALKVIRSWLNHIDNEPPQCLTQDQRKELDRLCCQAAAQVNYRLRQLATNARAADRATRKIEGMLPAGAWSQREEPPAREPTALPAMLSAPDLARWLDLPVSRVESALRRYRTEHRDCCQEVENRRRNEPRYLYRTADVLPVLQRLANEG
jgi:hypothetical protein